MGVESTIERNVCAYVFKHFGVVNIKLHVAGYPDRLFLIPHGAPLFIEFKAPGEAPRKLQKHIHTLIRSLGYNVQVHDNEQSAIEAIKAAHPLGSGTIPTSS